MSQNLRKSLRIALPVLVAAALVVVQADPALAVEAGVFGKITDKGKDLFNQVRTVIFILGGFGLVGLAVGAIFGKVNWKWFGGLAFGLVILAVAGAAVKYLTGADGGLTDTF